MPITNKKIQILNIQNIFNQSLTIPVYQRPYKWTIHHIQQLLNDLLHHFYANQRKYRIGTIVLHHDNGKNNIVDGQQRLISLSLLLLLLGQEENPLLNETLNHTISHDNILRNHQFIQLLIQENLPQNQQSKFKDYLLNTCEMVCVTLENLDEAFQFFDSQNSRGKPLESYDLLKAYHLREMKNKPEAVIHRSVAQWEEATMLADDAPNLNKIINQILFRLRRWHHQKSGERFTTNELPIFKGASETSQYPYLQNSLASMALAQLAQHSPLLFQNQFLHQGFQINQFLINGEYFFAYIEHYRKIYRQLFHRQTGLLAQINQIGHIELNKNLIEFLDTHQHSNRTGDRYLRALFECVVMAYFDKFGDIRLASFLYKAFTWVYRLRVEWQRITFATIDNLANDTKELLTVIERSYTPDMVMQFMNPKIEKKFHNVDNTILAILNVEKS